jgi:ribose 5-phosphate isomerase A
MRAGIGLLSYDALVASNALRDASPHDLDALAERALGLVRPGTIVGLGSGRAATAFVRALGVRVRAGFDVRCVATSEVIAQLGVEVGLNVTDLDGATLDLTVDGADEVDPRLDAIKGYGGALVRERIVAAASRRQVLLVGAEKLVPALGTRGRLPVEVLPFAARFCASRLGALGLEAELRQDGDRPFVTDNGHFILDCAVGPLPDPPATERTIRAVPGVVDTGLFLGTASLVLVAEAGAVRELGRRR